MDLKYGVISDWIYIYRRFLPDEELKNLQFQMTLQDDGNDRLETVSLFDCQDLNDSNSIIAIPRYCEYGLNLLRNNLLNEDRCDGEDIDINIKTPPRDSYQEDAINSILLNDHGILCAKTAFGKTYVAINAISRLKKRALILMHKRDLMYQWKEDFLKYTDLKDDDIQIFTGSKFKTGKKITITTVQNIGAKIRADAIELRNQFKNESFGVTFYDECHTTIGPLVNSLTSRWIFSKRVYGLSATPKRGDELDKVINSILGDVIYTDNRKMIPVYVSFSSVNVEIPFKTKFYLSKSSKQYTIRYNKWLSKQDNYVNHCANIIVELIKNNRKILVVAALKELLQVIYNKTVKIMEDNLIDLNKIRLIHGTTTIGFDSVKGMSDDEVENFNCIFSTNKFFSEGLSLNWLDTIVYLTPQSSKSLSSIPQLVGRIVREYKNKTFVNVFDIYNSAFDIENSRKYGRVNSYRSLNYHILNDYEFPYQYDRYVNYVLTESQQSSDSSKLMIPFDINLL